MAFRDCAARSTASSVYETDGPVPFAAEDDIHARARTLDMRLAGAEPETVIVAAAEASGRGRFAIVSSFGAESAVLLAVAAEVDPAIPILFLDTGHHFPETLAYRDLLGQRLGFTDIRSVAPEPSEITAEDSESDLFLRDPDACCALRKVRPLASALAGFSGWANGRKRYQGASRETIPVVEADGARLKFNPLANLSRAEIVARYRAHGLPAHPLEKFGFASIGCMPCTSRIAPGEDAARDAGADAARRSAAFTRAGLGLECAVILGYAGPTARGSAAKPFQIFYFCEPSCHTAAMRVG